MPWRLKVGAVGVKIGVEVEKGGSIVDVEIDAGVELEMTGAGSFGPELGRTPSGMEPRTVVVEGVNMEGSALMFSEMELARDGASS